MTEKGTPAGGTAGGDPARISNTPIMDDAAHFVNGAEAATEEFCMRCEKSVPTVIIAGAWGPHERRVECAICRKFIKWATKRTRPNPARPAGSIAPNATDYLWDRLNARFRADRRIGEYDPK